MNKTQFTKLIAAKMDVSMVTANSAINTIVNTIVNVLSREDNLMFVGFGAFKISFSKEKKVKTPNGTLVYVPKKRIVKFLPSNVLKTKINNI